jgi:hypothetical protein
MNLQNPMRLATARTNAPPLATFFFIVLCWTLEIVALGQSAPYDIYPAAEPPYFRVRFEPSTTEGELIYGANFTIWIPPNTDRLKGIIVHQHGCGEGSCKSGLTGAYDLHWQALASAHQCALLSPAYEQPEKADCQMWCDPRKGSAKAFLKAIDLLATKSNHPELSELPWALWGHSGGGHWCGGMAMLYPHRTVAAWLRSGVPLVEPVASRGNIQNYAINDKVLEVPLMCNVGTKEGVTLQDDRFSGVWPANLEFFSNLRSRGALIATSVDPLTSHECGNQRYLAIAWLNECLKQRLPEHFGQPLRSMNANEAWLVAHGSDTPISTDPDQPPPDALKWSWLPNQRIAKLWTLYSKDTMVPDDTPPPAPTNAKLQGDAITWDCQADLESGIAYFAIEKDGKEIARIPEKNTNPFGRPVFQGLQYIDTPPQPLAQMRFQIDSPLQQNSDTDPSQWSIRSVNTAGKSSKKTVVSLQ